jgi:acetyl esterase/lipase
LSTYPYLDLTDRYEAHPTLARWYKTALFDAASSYLGSSVFEKEHDILASPIRALEDAKEWQREATRALPPFFIACGSRDPFLQQCQRLKDALDVLDVPAELFIAPGEIHAFDAMVWRAPARAKWKATHAFLARHMMVKSNP